MMYCLIMSKFKTTSKRFALLAVAAIAIAACGGSSENSSSESTAAVRTKNAALTCAQGGTCAVGDTGPGGGTVFYFATANFTSGAPCGNTCRALEAAPTGWITSPSGQANCQTNGSSTVDPKCHWSGNTTTAIGSTARGTAIGTGFANTSAITKQNSTQGKAATVAKAYQGGGKTDWFLPSQDELIQMSANFKPDGDYWSSSECGNSFLCQLGYVWAQYKTLGLQAKPKSTILYVRPVRAFSATATPTYKVGASGPGGGKVFYVAPTYFTSAAPCGDRCKYLEAAPTGFGQRSVDDQSLWSANVNQSVSTYNGIGAGYANTSSMAMSSIAGSGNAATYARAFRGGSQTDWYLPSRDELSQMYSQKAVIGGFSSDNYWSSSEYDLGAAYGRNFGTGFETGLIPKSSTKYVRPVRAF
jgi:hypothetical protein